MLSLKFSHTILQEGHQVILIILMFMLKLHFDDHRLYGGCNMERICTSFGCISWISDNSYNDLLVKYKKEGKEMR